jgi:hypothetical protein
MRALPSPASGHALRTELVIPSAMNLNGIAGES